MWSAGTAAGDDRPGRSRTATGRGPLGSPGNRTRGEGGRPDRVAPAGRAAVSLSPSCELPAGILRPPPPTVVGLRTQVDGWPGDRRAHQGRNMTPNPAAPGKPPDYEAVGLSP